MVPMELVTGSWTPEGVGLGLLLAAAGYALGRWRRRAHAATLQGHAPWDPVHLWRIAHGLSPTLLRRAHFRWGLHQGPFGAEPFTAGFYDYERKRVVVYLDAAEQDAASVLVTLVHEQVHRELASGRHNRPFFKALLERCQELGLVMYDPRFKGVPSIVRLEASAETTLRLLLADRSPRRVRPRFQRGARPPAPRPTPSRPETPCAAV